MTFHQILMTSCLAAASSALSFGWIAQDLGYEDFASGARERMEVVEVHKRNVYLKPVSDSESESNADILPSDTLEPKQLAQIKVGDQIDVFHHRNASSRVIPALALESLQTSSVWKGLTLGLWALTLYALQFGIKDARRRQTLLSVQDLLEYSFWRGGYIQKVTGIGMSLSGIVVLSWMFYDAFFEVKPQIGWLHALTLGPLFLVCIGVGIFTFKKGSQNSRLSSSPLYVRLMTQSSHITWVYTRIIRGHTQIVFGFIDGTLDYLPTRPDLNQQIFNALCKFVPNATHGFSAEVAEAFQRDPEGLRSTKS
jgi:hypothetical protein